MSDASPSCDLANRRLTLVLLWGLPAVLMLLSATLARGGLVTLTWTVALAAMGAACLINARGCGRMHCFFTGPYFLIMAVFSLLHGAERLPLGPNGWLLLGIATAAGGFFLWIVPEWHWGRYRRTA